jgi:branched-chain amino acid transport system substrate-binding protein
MSFLGKGMTGYVIAAAMLALAGCGGSSKSASGVGGSSKTIDVYSSLPLRGASTAQTTSIVNGIRLALDQGGAKAGRWTVNYTSLDDSAAGGGFDPGAIAANARRAASDPRAVYYIGDFTSDASEVSIPILNQVAIPEVSPGSTYVGLTTNEPGSAPGEPGSLYPTGTRTFLRIVPRDTVEAAADLLAMKKAGCTRVAVANDGEVYGAGLASLLEVQKGFYGVTITSNTAINPATPNLRSYATTIKTQGADCLFYAGLVSGGAVQVTKDVHSAIPTARIFGGDRVCTRSYTSAVPAPVGSLIECTLPVLKLSAYPDGRAFLAAYKAKYGVANPNPYAIYGYEAMKLGLDTIAGLGSQGNSKLALMKALFATTARHSVLGTYGFDKNGDTTLTYYGLYTVGRDGTPVFARTITPTHVL